MNLSADRLRSFRNFCERHGLNYDIYKTDDHSEYIDLRIHFAGFVWAILHAVALTVFLNRSFGVMEIVHTIGAFVGGATAAWMFFKVRELLVENSSDQSVSADLRPLNTDKRGPYPFLSGNPEYATEAGDDFLQRATGTRDWRAIVLVVGGIGWPLLSLLAATGLFDQQTIMLAGDFLNWGWLGAVSLGVVASLITLPTTMKSLAGQIFLLDKKITVSDQAARSVVDSPGLFIFYLHAGFLGVISAISLVGIGWLPIVQSDQNATEVTRVFTGILPFFVFFSEIFERVLRLFAAVIWWRLHGERESY